MSSEPPPDMSHGDALVAMLGLNAEDPRVVGALESLARGMTPELDPEDDEDYVDWITINEIGLEFGFEDDAYVNALDQELRRRGQLLLSQLYFYGETEDMRAYPYLLPFGLLLSDDRRQVREKLTAFEETRRSYIRDVWRLPTCVLTVAYGESSGLLESILCQIPYAPWPELPDANAEILAISPDDLVPLFGMRWSDPRLRSALAAWRIDEKIGEIRSEREADLRLTHGVELMFTEGRQLLRHDPAHPRSLAFAAATFYAAREADAREWRGALPFGLSFDDSQSVLPQKVGRAPARKEDDEDELVGVAEWYFQDFTLSVTYSNVENRILRVGVADPGF